MAASGKLRCLALVVFLPSVHRLLATASIVPGLPILVTVMKEALSFVETSVLSNSYAA
jgi:hypothetical protein